jgi:hypothetical protein
VPARTLPPRFAGHPVPGARARAATPSAGSRLLATIEREALPLTAVALLVSALLASLPAQLVQDSWLALVAGRQIVADGLPLQDDLTILTGGATWIDQQWLGQLVLYGIHGLGGTRLLLALNVVLIGGSFVAAAAVGRRLGGSPTAIGLVGILAAASAPWSWQLRPQSLAYPLFVALLWLLATDARRPSARVLAVLPLLALWANVHGSVVLAAALVSLSGLLALSRRSSRLRGAALAAGGPLCVFVSPYLFDLFGYYRSTLGRSAFTEFVTEWRPVSPSVATAPFLVLVALAIVAVAVRRRRVAPLDVVLLLVTAAAAVVAIRSVIWFALAALVLVPSVLGGARWGRGAVDRRLLLGLGLGGIAALAAAAGVVVARPASWYEGRWPAQASTVASRAVANDPHLRVLASERTADWLLWTIPELKGRIAFDARFELMSDDTLARIAHLLRGDTPEWEQEARGYGLVVVDTPRRKLLRALAAEPGARILFADSDVVVVLRASRGAT